MEYKEIVSVTGLGGLFQLLTTKSDGAVVRNISDQSTKFISARMHNVTPLDTIEVYTTDDNVNLQEVFKKMLENESSVQPVDPKASDNNTIKNYFKTVFPSFDEERVYVSDMKKMLKWFNLLKEKDLLNFTEEEAQEEVAEEAPAEAPKTEATEEKPKKKATKKKAAAKPKADGEEAPAKKTARKKKTEE